MILIISNDILNYDYIEYYNWLKHVYEGEEFFCNHCNKCNSIYEIEYEICTICGGLYCVQMGAYYKPHTMGFCCFECIKREGSFL